MLTYCLGRILSASLCWHRLIGIKADLFELLSYVMQHVW
jgi:hypothetical protein